MSFFRIWGVCYYDLEWRSLGMAPGLRPQASGVTLSSTYWASIKCSRTPSSNCVALPNVHITFLFFGTDVSIFMSYVILPHLGSTRLLYVYPRTQPIGWKDTDLGSRISDIHKYSHWHRVWKWNYNSGWAVKLCLIYSKYVYILIWYISTMTFLGWSQFNYQ